jgi:hypothetical protein
VRKAVESEQRRAVHNDVTALNRALQTDELSLVHLVASQQLGVIAKITQEPGQLPESLRAAIESAGNDVPGKSAELENGQRERVVRLLFMSTKLDSLHCNEKDPVRDLVSSTAIGGMLGR